MSDDHAPPALRRLRDPDPERRRAAIIDLGGDPRALGPLLARALADDDWDVRRHAAWAVRGLVRDRAVRLAQAAGPLLAALGDADQAIRGNAAAALARIDHFAAGPPVLATRIRPLLRDSSPYVRLQAAFWMASFAAEADRPALEALLADPDPQVAAMAARALEGLGAEPPLSPG